MPPRMNWCALAGLQEDKGLAPPPSLRFRACIARDVEKSRKSGKTESLLFIPRRENDGYKVARECVV